MSSDVINGTNFHFLFVIVNATLGDLSALVVIGLSSHAHDLDDEPYL
jgi:hypothetical protein